MKKVYLAPLTKVVKINAEQMICQSIESIAGDALIVKGSNATSGEYVADDKDEFIDIKKVVNNDFEEEMDELW